MRHTARERTARRSGGQWWSAAMTRDGMLITIAQI
jgi:hypothetical protein